MKNLEIVINPYSSAISKNRRGLFVTAKNKDQIKKYVKVENITALYVNSSKGWNGNNFDFLEGLDTIEELDIINSECRNIGGIKSMSCLQELSITAGIKEKVDFSDLKNLSKCYLSWWKGAESIFNCDSLKSMYLDGVPDLLDGHYDLPKGLKQLTIANSKVESLAFVKGVTLDLFALYNCKKINNFDMIANIKSLLRLEIRGCKKLESVGFVKSLKLLEVAIISDNGSLDSLSYFENILSLKALAFAGNTSIEDGDLGVLVNLPNLSMLMFGAKKHYTHKLIKSWNWNNFNTPDKLLELK